MGKVLHHRFCVNSANAKTQKQKEKQKPTSSHMGEKVFKELGKNVLIQ